MTDTNDKIRSLFMATLMVLSVFAMTVGFAGTAAAVNYAEEDYDDTIDDGTVHYTGQLLFYDLTNTDTENEQVTIRNEDGDPVQTTSTGEGGSFLLDTSVVGTGSFSFADGTSTVNFSVIDQNLSAEFNVSSTDQTPAQLQLRSNRGSYQAVVSSDNLSSSQVDSLLDGTSQYNETASDAQGATVLDVTDRSNIDVPFSTDVSPGEYTFNVEALDTDAADNTSITVVERGDETVSFAGDKVFSATQGDRIEITVDLQNTADAYVTIGGDDFGYTSTVHVTDDDEDGDVTFTFNTYRAGKGGDVFESQDDGVSVETEGSIGPNDTLDAGDYDMTTGTDVGDESGHVGDDQASDVGSVVINERSAIGEDDVEIMTAPQNARSDLSDAQDVLNVSAGADSIAENDQIVVRVAASGVYGYLDGVDDLNIDGSNESSEGLNLTVVETDDSTGPNQDPRVFDLSTDNADLYTDEENNQFFLVVRASSTNIVDGTSDDTIAGDEYDATFTIDDNNAYVATDESESASATFSVDERTAELDEPVQVESAANQTITGTTTVADGTEMSVRAKSTGDSPFLKPASVTVEDGEFSAEFDFSDVTTGTTFTVSATNADDVEGEVVEDAGGDGTPTPTPDQTPTPTETDENGGEDEGTPTPTEGTEETPGDSPGFGVVAAVLAMLAAALIAVRRD